MGFWSGTKTVVTKGLNIRIDKWMSLDMAQETLNRVRYIAKDLFIPKRATYSETFEEATDRLGLSEEDFAQRKKEFTRLYLTFTVLGLIILGYGLYMLFLAHFSTALITVFLSLYAFAQAFKFHFWLFQIKNRKLGCTISEWLNSSVHGPEDPTNKDKS